MRKKNNFIDDITFTKAVSDYAKQCSINEGAGKPLPRMNDYIGKSILDMANELAKKKNFSGYSYIEDMKGTAIEDVVKYLKNFNPEKSPQGPHKGAFNYVTTIMHYAFLRYIKKEAKQHDIQKNLIFYAGIIDEISETQAGDDRTYDNGYLLQLQSSVNDFYRIGVPDTEETPSTPPEDKKTTKAPKAGGTPVGLEEFFG